MEPSLTGHGIGSALLARATDELRASGYAPLFIWALESNEQARAFYGKKGWWQDRGRKLSGEETVIRCRLLQTGRETE